MAGKPGKLSDLETFHPTSWMQMGYEILFFWMARMILMSTYALDQIPFKDVYIHGMLRSESGKKFSKSSGNNIDPLEVISKFGTDALRLSVIGGIAPGNDSKFYEEKVEGARNLINKIWNIARYIQTSYGFNQKLLAGSNLGQLNATMADNWILFKFQNLIRLTTEDLNNYHFSQAGELLREFTWNDLADWYLEASKFEKSEAKQIILTHIIANLLKLWHPFIPFVTETIWQEINNSNMLIIEAWPKGAVAEIKTDFDLIKDIITAIRNARAENNVEPAKKIKAVIYAGNQKELIESQVHLIKNLRTGISELEVLEEGKKLSDAIYVAVGDIEIYLLGAVDAEKEKVRIEKEITNLEKIIASAKVRLSNKEFTDKAPAEIVKKEKEKLKNWQAELKSLKSK